MRRRSRRPETIWLTLAVRVVGQLCLAIVVVAAVAALFPERPHLRTTTADVISAAASRAQPHARGVIRASHAIVAALPERADEAEVRAMAFSQEVDAASDAADDAASDGRTEPASIVPIEAIAADSTMGSFEARMLALINASRVAAGLVPVMLDVAVSGVARSHSATEANVRYVYHDGADGTAHARDAAACGSGWYGENTGKIWGENVDALHSEFMREPWVPINHRTNVMDPAFRRVGIGAVFGVDAMYMTMVFCR